MVDGIPSIFIFLMKIWKNVRFSSSCGVGFWVDSETHSVNKLNVMMCCLVLDLVA